MRQRESKIKPSDVPTSDEREGGERGEGEEGDGDGSGGRGGPRPSTPPPKEEAFEQFKKERGSEINKILLSNKGQWVQIYTWLPDIGVHEMHGRMHPNYCQITILLVVDLCSSLAYFMMIQPLPIASAPQLLSDNYFVGS